MTEAVYTGRALILGSVTAELLRLDEPISFWGGVDPNSGTIIDANHPQVGQSLADKILVLPGTRGSTASPGALLETLAAGNGPSAFILTLPDNVCLVAASMCAAIGLNSPPILDLSGQSLAACRSGQVWALNNNRLARVH
jgi:uncharacterized protein